ncbi:MAG: imidazole glycerol phosphate synthase subunit HisH, partial [Psychroserpens sp.]|nr:imidazole glycerol phosphate synthase subunit HisH [Psychroserpens sp.]
IKRFNANVKVPQIGWNTINNLKSDLFKGINEGDYMYLVHSYYAERCSEAIAISDYGLQYASALQSNNFYGVQFHPEKSSTKGEQLLKNFLEL